MSATTEIPTTTPVTQPEVAESTGKVGASDAFVNASENPHSAVTEPIAARETTPAETAAARETMSSTEEKVGKKETQITATPVSSGILGYKAPGLMSQLRFKPHFFELGDAPVPTSDLTQFLRGEKPDVAHPTAAWSSQTGKGLLYISKNEDSKKSPGSILNLADITHVAKEGDKMFSFRLGRHKHSFEAKNQDQRNGWLAAVESAHESAAQSKDEIHNSQGYKDTMSGLNSGKSHTPVAATAGAAGAAAAGGAGAAAGTHVHDDKKEEKAEKRAEDRRKSDSDDEKKNAKSRSRSNKRSSVFGSILGKKDDKKEEKKDEKAEKTAEKDAKKEEKEEKKEEKEEKKEEKAVATAVKKEEKKEEKEEKKAEKEVAKEIKQEQKEEKEEEKAVEKEIQKEEKENKKHQHESEAAAAGTAGVGATTAAEHKRSDKAEESPKENTERSKSKRRSIFGIFDKKSPNTEKREADVVPTGTTSSGASPEAKKVENKVVDTFKDDPTSAERSTASKDATAAAPTATVPEVAKGEEATSPSTSKRTSILGSVFRRPSKQVKAEEAKKDKKDAAAHPATVPETLEANKAPTNVTNATDVAPTQSKTAAPSAEAPKLGEPAIGDVVPDAVTVGEPDASKPAGTMA